MIRICYNRINIIFMLFLITCLIPRPIYLESSILDRQNYVTLHTDWKNLIGNNFEDYQIKFSTSLSKVEDSSDLAYNIYQYQDSLIYVCKESNIIHHVSIRNPDIKICDTYVGMRPSQVQKQHGKATLSQETLITKKWVLQYAYDHNNNYNLSTRSLTYTSKEYYTPITDITYGYTLPLYPDKVVNITSIKDAKKHLQGKWLFKDSKELIFDDRYLFDYSTFNNNSQNQKNFFLLSPNEMLITHNHGDNSKSIISLRFIFNKDYNKVFLFSTDKYGIPIENTIDMWVRSP